MNRHILWTALLLAALLCGCQAVPQPQSTEFSANQQTEPTEITEAESGWQTLDGRRYYILPNGTAITGWLSLEEGRYYLDETGAAVTGRATVDGKDYYFDSEGRVTCGIVELEGALYLFGPDGILASPGWTSHGDSQYYIIENGQVYTGWLLQDKNSYYLKPDGAMAVGRTEVNGEIFYFTPDGVHVTVVNPWHFLPEDYTVDRTTVRGYQVDASCAEALEQMLSACEKEGLEPRICSAYRSQEKQEQLFSKKVRSYTSKGHSEEEAKELAGTEVAVPGTSEHQLGLAVDIVDNSNWNLDETQASTPTQLWLMEHCWEYGFILRYPNEKSAITGIIYEPWHYRYVGVEIAMELKDSGLCLEEYLDAVVE